MAIIKWTPSLSVNIEEMDKQHQGLFEIMNRLHGVISTGKGNESQKTVVDELIDYTHKHFSAEEKLMQRFRFPQLARHKAEHVKFTEEVIEFRRRIQGGETVSAYAVLEFLRQWLLTHIQESDIRYGKFINQFLQKIAIKT
jgi:hemerythrin